MVVAITISHPRNSTGIIAFIKNDQEILLHLANFAFQEQPEDI